MDWLEERVRDAQEEQENIIKSQLGDFEKARAGVYKNTSENRKLGRVGQKYGSKKEKTESSFEDKVKSLKSDLKNQITTAIIKAVNSYNHTPETVKELENKISTLNNLNIVYENEKNKVRSMGTDESWERFSEIRKEQRPIKNALIAYEIAKSSSEILQKYGAKKGIGMSDIDDQMSMFSDFRTLVNRARNYEEKIN